MVPRVIASFFLRSYDYYSSIVSTISRVQSLKLVILSFIYLFIVAETTAGSVARDFSSFFISKLINFFLYQFFPLFTPFILALISPQA